MERRFKNGAWLAPYLRHASPLIRWRAALALARLQDCGLFSSLIRLVHDYEPAVRRMAAFAIWKSCPAKAGIAEAELAARYALEPDPRVRAGLARALGKIGTARSVPLLIQALADKSRHVRADAALALGELGSRRRGGFPIGGALKSLSLLADDEDHKVRYGAAYGLTRLALRGYPAASRLAWAFRDALPEVRALALKAFGLKGLEDREILKRLLSDPDRRVRRQARLAEIRTRVGKAGKPRPGQGPMPGPGGPLGLKAPASTKAWPAQPSYPRLKDGFHHEALLHTTKGTIKIGLNKNATPRAAAYFTALARKRYYDKTGVCPDGPEDTRELGCRLGRGGIEAPAFLANEFHPRVFTRGSVGLRWPQVGAKGPLFFITLSRKPRFDGEYILFARVVSGLEAAEALGRDDRLLGIELKSSR